MSIYVNLNDLNDDETRDLEELAAKERRTVQQQAAYMIVSQLAQRKAFENMQARLEAEFPQGCTADPTPSGFDVMMGGPIPGKRIAVGEEAE